MDVAQPWVDDVAELRALISAVGLPVKSVAVSDMDSTVLVCGWESRTGCVNQGC